MFMGEYQHTIDDKGRLILPSRFRELLAPGLVVTRGLENCLFVYTLDQWRLVQKQLQGLAFTSATNRAFVRFFLSGAVDCQLDRQGRVLIPQNLREYAGLDRETVVIGVLDRLEIWDQAKWEAYRDRAGENFESLAETLDGVWQGQAGEPK
ncbi:MAG: division/cell wall cluster transcriptional repressor MraZ [Bacillota bacterium]